MSVYTTDTCEFLWNEHVCVEKEKGEVIWLYAVGYGKVGCGTKEGQVTIFAEDASAAQKLHSWNAGENTEDYTYNSAQDVILSLHKSGVVNVWKEDGVSEDKFEVGPVGSRITFCSHPTEELIAIGSTSPDLVKVFNISTKVEIFTADLNGYVIQYDLSGERLFTGGQVSNKIKVLDSQGNVVNEIRGQSGDYIEDMCSVPVTGDLVTIGLQGCMLLEVPKVPDGDSDQKAVDIIEQEEKAQLLEKCVDCQSMELTVLACGMLPGGQEFFTMVACKCLKIWDAETLLPLRGMVVEGLADEFSPGMDYIAFGGAAYAHPTEQLVLVKGDNAIYLSDIIGMSICKEIEFDEMLTCLSVSPKGDKCVVGCEDGTCHVINISSGQGEGDWSLDRAGIECETREATFVDIHSDGIRVVSAGKGIHLWDINTGEIINTFNEHHYPNMVKFVTQGVVYDDRRERIFSIDLEESERAWKDELWQMESKPYGNFLVVNDGKHLLIGENNTGICLKDVSNGQLVHTLMDHRFNDPILCFLEIRSSCVLAYSAFENELRKLDIRCKK